MKRMTKVLMVAGMILGILSLGSSLAKDRWDSDWLPDWVKLTPRESARVTVDLTKIADVEQVTILGRDGMKVVILVDEMGYLRVSEGCPPRLEWPRIFVDPQGDSTVDLGKVRVGPGVFWLDRDQDGTEEQYAWPLREAPEDGGVIDLGWSLD